MTDLKAEAKQLIEKIPEEELAQIMSTLRAAAKPPEEKDSMAALARIVERARKNREKIPADFDYKKELEEIREERFKKYANPNVIVDVLWQRDGTLNHKFVECAEKF